MQKGSSARSVSSLEGHQARLSEWKIVYFFIITICLSLLCKQRWKMAAYFMGRFDKALVAAHT